MKISYFTIFPPIVDVNVVVDDFGNEQKCEMSYAAFNAAKIFHTGMTFEDAKYCSTLEIAEFH